MPYSKTNWYELQSLLEKEVPKRVATKSYWLKFFALFALFGALYYSVLFTTSDLQLVLYFQLLGFLLVMIAFSISHDAAHSTLLKSKRLNTFIYYFTSTLMGVDGWAWQHRHVFEHHLYPNMKDHDPDLSASTFFRFEPQLERKWWHQYQWFYALPLYATYSLYWILIKDTVLLFRLQRSWDKYVLFAFQKIVYACLFIFLPLSVTELSISIYLFAFFLMHLSSSMVLLLLFLLSHHQGESHYFVKETNDTSLNWFKYQVEGSFDVAPFSFLFTAVCGGFNCHVAHHLFPGYHHSRYKKINKILYPYLASCGVVIAHSSLGGAVRKHFQYLYQMGR